MASTGSSISTSAEIGDDEGSKRERATTTTVASAKEAMEWTTTCHEWGMPSVHEDVYVPLLDYLCAYMRCSLKELQVLFNNLEARRRMLQHMRSLVHLRTNHLHPAERNQWLHAHDLSVQNANLALACGGYLDITVRQYYYIKHGRKLKHPYLPCLIEFGGGQHVSYYPLELLVVRAANATHHCNGAMQLAIHTNKTTDAIDHHRHTAENCSQ